MMLRQIGITLSPKLHIIRYHHNTIRILSCRLFGSGSNSSSDDVKRSGKRSHVPPMPSMFGSSNATRSNAKKKSFRDSMEDRIMTATLEAQRKKSTERARLAARSPQQIEEDERKEREQKERIFTFSNSILAAIVGGGMVGWALWEAFDTYYEPNTRLLKDWPLLEPINRVRIQDVYSSVFECAACVSVGTLMGMMLCQKSRVVRLVFCSANLLLAYTCLVRGDLQAFTGSSMMQWKLGHVALGAGASFGSTFLALALVPMCAPIVCIALGLSSGATAAIFGHNDAKANPTSDGRLVWLMLIVGGFCVGESLIVAAPYLFLGGARTAGLVPAIMGVCGVPIAVILSLRYPQDCVRILEQLDRGVVSMDEYFALIHEVLNPVPDLLRIWRREVPPLEPK